jgi:hypothetical protein
MSISISLDGVDDLDQNEWQNLAENSAVPYYINQEIDYADILASYGVKSYFLQVYDGSGLLIGGICLYQSETKIGRILSHNGGPIYLENHIDDVKRGIIEFYREYRRSFLNISLQFLPPSQLFSGTYELGKPLNPDYTSIIDLNRPWELIEGGIRKQRRHSIKIALKDGYEIKVLDGLSEWKESYDILAEHAISHKYPIQSWDLWKKIYEKYMLSGKRFAFGAFLGNEMTATLGLTLIHGYSTFNYLASNSFSPEASSLLTYHAIKFCKERGGALFNLSGLPLQGSFLEGIRIFKKSFGGKTVGQEGYCSNPLFRAAINIGRNVRISNFINRIARRSGTVNSIFYKIKQNTSNIPIPDEGDPSQRV